MDYKIIGIYNEKKESTFNGSFLHLHEGKKYEIMEVPSKKRYAIKGHSVIVDGVVFPLHQSFQKIALTDTFLFICYKKTLEIFSLEGDLVKEVVSKEPIVVGPHGFILFNKVHYILNLDAHSVFVHRHDNILSFTGEGRIFAAEPSRIDVGEIKQQNMGIASSEPSGLGDGPGTREPMLDQTNESKKSDRHVEGSETDFAKENMLTSVESGSTFNEERCFVVQDLNNKTVYNVDGEVLLSFQGYEVFRGTARILNVVTCTSIKLQVFSTTTANDNSDSSPMFSDCITVLCSDFVFVILDDIVVKKPLNEKFTHILPEKFVVHTYVSKCSIYDCLLLINCIRPTSLFKTSEIEGFLVALMNIGIGQNAKFVEGFIKGLELNSKAPAKHHRDYQTILCRVYRQVDDDSKKFLDRHISFKVLDADQMFYIIIYKPELVKNFIHLCKLQRRLFYLEDLRDFYIKTGRVGECKRLFLENGVLLFEYNGVEKFYEIEKRQIESQRLEFGGSGGC